MNPKKISSFLIALSGIIPSPSFSQLTQAQKDSGWVDLFNGKDLGGFFTMFGGVKGPADAKGVFSVKDGAIHATGAGGSGYLETDKKYSFYRWRVDFKFAVSGGNPNAGLMYGIHDEVRWANDKTWPRGIEAQGQKKGVGDFWGIGLVIEKTKIAAGGGCKYKEDGIPHTFGAGNQTDDRKCQASELRYVDNQWNTEEVWQWGADSVYHLVNGKVVFKAWKLRWSDKADTNDMSHPLIDGGLAVQSEGGEISYRNLQIMELDPITLKPINASPTNALTLSSKNDAIQIDRKGSRIIVGSEKPNMLAEVYDREGRIMWSNNLTSGQKLISPELPRGIYFVVIGGHSSHFVRQVALY